MSTRILLLVAVCAAAAGRVTAASAVGSWEQITNLNDQKIQELGRWAVVAENKRLADKTAALTYNRVYGAEKQVVAGGVSYDLHLVASSSAAMYGRYMARVYVQAGTNTRKLVSFEPTH
ncbi:hypothetical protein GUJ93_ZPchr0006g44282 [Zizania palustris]|uniref:Cystatin domain-containing protein n=1 Tax=Zizania palustris TaxID=103762 RepID=A0A8J5W2R1_ZIZPA|nr:hypothetical protein GUJ93_ZPchr0006g44282 [Zizania palustris]